MNIRAYSTLWKPFQGQTASELDVFGGESPKRDKFDLENRLNSIGKSLIYPKSNEKVIFRLKKCGENAKLVPKMWEKSWKFAWKM